MLQSIQRLFRWREARFGTAWSPADVEREFPGALRAASDRQGVVWAASLCGGRFEMRRRSARGWVVVSGRVAPAQTGSSVVVRTRGSLVRIAAVAASVVVLSWLVATAGVVMALGWLRFVQGGSLMPVTVTMLLAMELLTVIWYARLCLHVVWSHAVVVLDGETRAAEAFVSALFPRPPPPGAHPFR